MKKKKIECGTGTESLIFRSLWGLASRLAYALLLLDKAKYIDLLVIFMIDCLGGTTVRIWFCKTHYNYYVLKRFESIKMEFVQKKQKYIFVSMKSTTKSNFDLIMSI